MKLCGKELTLLNIFFLILYYGFCRYLPSNSTPIIGQISKECVTFVVNTYLSIAGRM